MNDRPSLAIPEREVKPSEIVWEKLIPTVERYCRSGAFEARMHLFVIGKHPEMTRISAKVVQVDRLGQSISCHRAGRARKVLRHL